jgi:hypothetical protein
MVSMTSVLLQGEMREYQWDALRCGIWVKDLARRQPQNYRTAGAGEQKTS